MKNSEASHSEASHHVDIGFLLFLLFLGIIVYRNVQYHRTFMLLRQLDREHVKCVKIYPETAGPSHKYFELQSSAPIVSELLQSFAGSRAIWLQSRFTVSDGFFLEIVTEERKIQGVFQIPAGRIYIVGEFGTWRQSSQTCYGEFRSKKLYQWYRKYSHRWLESAESTQRQGASQQDGQWGSDCRTI